MRHRVTIVRTEPIGDGPDGSVFFRIGSNEYEAFAPWVEDFRANDALTRKIVRTHGWNYEAHGIVRSIEPTIVDFGDLVLSMNPWTHDRRVVGAGVRMRLRRLEIWDVDGDPDGAV